MQQIELTLDVLVLVATVLNTVSWLAKTNTPYWQMPRQGLGKWLFAAEAVILPLLAMLYLLGKTSSDALIILACLFCISSFLYSIVRRMHVRQLS